MGNLTRLDKFTLGAMMGLAANPERWGTSDTEIAAAAISLAETTLRKLEAKNTTEEEDGHAKNTV